MKKVLLDCDPGIDDSLAIMLAVNSGVISLEHISTTHGTGPVEQTARNAQRVVEYLGIGAVVNQGSTKPWYVDPMPPQAAAHGEDGLGGTNLLPLDPSQQPSKQNFAQFLVNAVKSGVSTIVATGPLTNIARAFRSYPTVMNGIDELVMMGGVFDVPGNAGPSAEVNFYADPHAADYVLTETKVRKVIVPLNITRQVLLTPKMNERFSNSLSATLAKSIAAHYQDFSQRVVKLQGCPLHDPLAMGYAIDPSFLELTEMRVVVEPEGKYTRGECVVDRRPGRQKEPNVFVATGVDAQKFLDYFIETISK